MTYHTNTSFLKILHRTLSSYGEKTHLPTKSKLKLDWDLSETYCAQWWTKLFKLWSVFSCSLLFLTVIWLLFMCFFNYFIGLLLLFCIRVEGVELNYWTGKAKWWQPIMLQEWQLENWF